MEKLRWWQRWDRALVPHLGPAQLGPYGEPPLPSTAEKPCPLCGQPMNLHRFERSTDHTATRMHCPKVSPETAPE